MANNFYPYPTSLPVEELKCLAGMLRGQALNVEDALHAGWVVVGYGKAQLPALLPAPMASSACPCSKEDLACHMEAAAAGGMRGVIPWALIVSELAPVLIDLAKKLLTPGA